MDGNGDHIQVLMLLKYIKKSVDIVINTKSFHFRKSGGTLVGADMQVPNSSAFYNR
ncbi:Uncharacterised protein [Collinsella aerofaciens]|uniref:Uncharacterized protein n=1 Tax=Collinsella aerofaciens TaxID=74426 RepID=A0A6N3CBV5_9ACTN